MISHSSHLILLFLSVLSYATGSSSFTFTSPSLCSSIRLLKQPHKIDPQHKQNKKKQRFFLKSYKSALIHFHRGGASSPSSLDVTIDDDNSDDKRNPESVIVDVESEEMEDENPLIGSSYNIVGFLWISVALDILMNPTKRKGLFGMEHDYPRIAMSFGASSSNFLQSLNLSSGFVLAAGIALVSSLNLSFGGKSTIMSTNSGNRKPSSRAQLIHETSIILMMFGAINLLTQLIPKAPYLGLSGGVINFHNMLVGFNEWRKSKSEITHDPDEPSTVVGGMVSFVKNAFTISSPPSNFSRLQMIQYFGSSMTYIFTLGIVFYQIIQSMGSLLTHSVLQHHHQGVSLTAISRVLNVASLARYILLFGIVKICKQGASSANVDNSDLFRGYNGVLSIYSLMGVVASLSSIIGGYGSLVQHKIQLFVLLTFSTITAFQCLLPMGSHPNKAKEHDS